MSATVKQPKTSWQYLMSSLDFMWRVIFSGGFP